MNSDADWSTFLAPDESFEVYATAFALNALAVCPGVPLGEVTHVESLNKNLHCSRIVGVVRFADEFQIDVVKVDRL